MQLQVALDRMELDVAVDMAARTAENADWIEVGTSLIKRYGVRSVSEIVAAAGGTPVLADLKTADDAATEFGMAFERGARGATVLAATTDATIDRCAALAADAGADAVLDLLATSPERREHLLNRLPSDVVLAEHVGRDAREAGTGVAAALGAWTRGRRVAVAGGIGRREIEQLRAPHPDLRVIIGSAITGAADPATAARDVLTAMRGERG